MINPIDQMAPISILKKLKISKNQKKIFFMIFIEAYRFLAIYGEFISMHTFDKSHSSNDPKINNEKNKNFKKLKKNFFLVHDEANQPLA